jgi:hypothetical protein
MTYYALLTSALRSDRLTVPSVAEATQSRSPGVSSVAFRASSPGLRFASLMDMDFAVSGPLVRHSCLLPDVCPSTRTFAIRFLQTSSRGDSPCVAATGVTIPSRFTLGNDFLASATAWLGYSYADRWLVFVRGGAAWTREKTDIAFTNLAGIPVDPSATTNRTGWTVGTGVDWAFAPHWSANLEIQLLRLR